MHSCIRSVVCLCCLLPAFTVQAGGVWKDGPFLGYAAGGDVEKAQLAGGWNVAHEFNDTLSMEGAITAQQDEYIPGFLEAPLNRPLDLTILSTTIGGRTAWFYNPVSLHLGAGGGYYIFNGDDENIRVAIAAHPEARPSEAYSKEITHDIDGSFGLYAGAGMEILLSRRWEMFMDWRHVWLDTDIHYSVWDRTGLTTGETKTYNESLDYNHNLFRLGIQYRF